MKIKKRTAARILSNLVLVLAVIIFGISAYKLINIGGGYAEGRSEYKEIQDLVIQNKEDEEKFRVDFDKLMEMNQDTIGWIRFYPARCAESRPPDTAAPHSPAEHSRLHYQGSAV